MRLTVGRRTISRDSQQKARQNAGSQLRLLPSGLYRRLRNSTGSCIWYYQTLAGFHRRSGLGRHSARPHPNPEGLFLVSIRNGRPHIYPRPERAGPSAARRSYRPRLRSSSSWIFRSFTPARTAGRRKECPRMDCKRDPPSGSHPVEPEMVRRRDQINGHQYQIDQDAGTIAVKSGRRPGV
jgi:hypothetical protein